MAQQPYCARVFGDDKRTRVWVDPSDEYDLADQLVSALLRTADNNPITDRPDSLKHFDYLYDKTGNRKGIKLEH